MTCLLVGCLLAASHQLCTCTALLSLLLVPLLLLLLHMKISVPHYGSEHSR